MQCRRLAAFSLVFVLCCGGEEEEATKSDAGPTMDAALLDSSDAAASADSAVETDAGGDLDAGAACDGSSPVIAEVVGELTHGSAFTILGGCFGTRTDEPYLWDDAESSYDATVDGSAVPVGDGHPWARNPEGAMQFASDNGRGRSRAHYAGSGARRKTSVLGGTDPTPGPGGEPTIYISWWARVDRVTSRDASAKLIRLWAGDMNGRTYRLSWTTMHMTYGYDEDLGTEADPWAHESHPMMPTDWGTWSGEAGLSMWHRQELLFVSSSRYDVEDGRILATTDGVADHDITLSTWREGRAARPDERHDHERFGFDPPNRIGLLGLDPSVPVGDYELGLDDVWIDFSPARVEICDMPRWSERSGAHCELQPRATWVDDRIEGQIHQGSLDGEELYLYVVRDDLVTNEAGVPVLLADGT